jgi:hypothetical protein
MLLMPILIKRFGLKRPWLLFQLMQACVYVCLLLNRSLAWQIALISIYGFTAASCSFTYIYMSDMLPLKSVPIAGTLYYVLDGLTLGFQSIYFMTISTYYQYYMIFVIVCSFLVFTVSGCYLVESPMKLLAKGDINRAKLSMQRIATVNGKHCSEELDCLLKVLSSKLTKNDDKEE